MVEARPGRALAAPLLALLAVTGCSSQEDLRRAELLTLAGTLPGVWDNQAQVLAERAGSGPIVHLAEQLEIVRAAAPVLGKVVFLVREHASADTRRVLSERLWIFDTLGGKTLPAQVARFAEPERWAGERAAPELLRSIVPQDIANLPGCTLVWTLADGVFSAATPAPGCPGPSAGQRVAQHWRVSGTQLEFAEHPAGQAPLASDWLQFEQRTPR